MSYFERRLHIDAPPAVVWGVLADVARWPEWTASMRKLVPQGGGPLGAGSRVLVTMRGTPGSVWRVTAYEEGRSFTWETERGVRVSAGHLIEQDGAGSKVTLSLRTSGVLAALFSLVIRPMSRRNMQLEAEGLKHRSEERARPAGPAPD